jgi:hypothetical protein
MTGLGNEAQVRLIAEQLVDAAMTKVGTAYAVPVKPEIPAPLKWAAGILTAIFSALAIGAMMWGITTLADLKDTVTRIDERQRLSGDSIEKRLTAAEDRISRLENHSVKGGAE